MPNGYAAPILTYLDALSTNLPNRKLSPLGFLKMLLCCQDGGIQNLNERYDGGHTRDFAVAYRKRVSKSNVRDTPSACDTAITPQKGEFTLPSLLYREIPIWIPDTLIRNFTQDVSNYVKIPERDSSAPAEMKSNTNVMKEVYDMILDAARALTEAINDVLVTQMATQFGTNVVTGATTARALSFSLSTTAMTDAFVQLMSDWRENELCDDVCIVGNGPFSNFELIKDLMTCCNQQGVDQAKLMNVMPTVGYDKATRSIWGANQVGVFEKDSVSFLTWNKYIGNFARHVANSEFFSMALPVNEYACPQDCLDRLAFDVQIKEFDCPTSLTLDGVVTTTSGPGVLVVLSKYFNLFTRPNLYNVGDELSGVNGTFRYTITGS